jgi:DNA-binding NarL/FixJ family response regulator
MPETDGIYALLKIKENYPQIKVIMLTTFEEENYIFKTFENAVDGYILKDTKPEALINTVKCVQDGFFVMNKAVQQYIEQKLIKMVKSEEMVAFVDEKLDFDQIDLKILKLLSMGKNNAEIARNINYSEGTIKNRISRMLEMTALKDRTQLAIFALQNRII